MCLQLHSTYNKPQALCECIDDTEARALGPAPSPRVHYVRCCLGGCASSACSSQAEAQLAGRPSVLPPAL